MDNDKILWAKHPASNPPASNSRHLSRGERNQTFVTCGVSEHNWAFEHLLQPSGMASDGVQALPADLWHLITSELADRAIQAESQELARPEYAALCNCILSSKFLASAGALVALYR